jgi:hypothetical protein
MLQWSLFVGSAVTLLHIPDQKIRSEFRHTTAGADDIHTFLRMQLKDLK